MNNLILLAGYCFVAFLLWCDTKQRKFSSSALWIPGLWLFFIGTRGPQFWFSRGSVGETSRLEGSPINFLVFSGLILSSVIVLSRRNLNWSEFASKNKGLVLLYLFFLASCAWSQFPVPTIKRVFNDLGNALIPLVILTEPEPAEMIKTVYARLAFVYLPMSVVVIRFFPDIGRTFSRAGEPMFCGLSDHKNSMGELSMLLSLVLLWTLLEQKRRQGGSFLKKGRRHLMVALAIGIYLVVISASATALSCLLIGAALLFVTPFLQRRFSTPQKLAVAVIVGAVFAWALNAVFDINAEIFYLLGRNQNLTGRTDIWEAIGQRHVNPFVGAGFRGFWETTAGVSVFKDLDAPELITAHNGYLEVFLNGGVPAVTMLGMFLISSAALVLKRVTAQEFLGPFSVVVFVVALFNNVSESIFFIGDPLWFTLLLAVLAYPQPRQSFVIQQEMIPAAE